MQAGFRCPAAFEKEAIMITASVKRGLLFGALSALGTWFCFLRGEDKGASRPAPAFAGAGDDAGMGADKASPPRSAMPGPNRCAIRRAFGT
jgi:hypothetical protein